MARASISECKAKKLLLGETYKGWQVNAKELKKVVSKLPQGKYVLKVDQGIKKRHKQGLLVLDLTPKAIPAALKKLHAKGYQQFVIEPMVPHKASEERYLSLERVRGGIKILYSLLGGVDIEDNADSILQATYSGNDKILADIERALSLQKSFLKPLITRMNDLYISFIEINPLVVKMGQPQLLDCAVQVDSTASWFVGGQWNEDDLTESGGGTSEERAVKELSENSPSSLTLRVLNPDGSLLLFLCGGGVSIAVADEAYQQGFGKQIIDYGEYSGSPTAEETYLYTRQLLQLLLKSKSPKKAVIFGGSVANFTDVAVTFKGFVPAVEEVAPQLRRQKIKFFIRRGGPNEAEGLELVEAALHKLGLFGSVDGSDVQVVKPVREAIKELR